MIQQVNKKFKIPSRRDGETKELKMERKHSVKSDIKNYINQVNGRNRNAN